MSDGMSGIRKAAEDVAARKAAGGDFSQDVELKMESGKSVRVRFLDTAKEIDKQWAWMHEMPARGKAKWGDNVPCLDQAGDGATRCPGCERGLDRAVEGFLNVLWYDGPVYAKKVEDGKERIDFKNVEGRGDVLAIWARGIMTLEELDALDVKFKGLHTRDVEVQRNTAKGMDTRYTIGPYLDPQTGDSKAEPLTAELQKLADTKPDLSVKVRPMTYEQMETRLAGRTLGPGASTPQEAQSADDLAAQFDNVTSTSPFERKG
jgi:hypothetical protein